MTTYTMSASKTTGLYIVELASYLILFPLTLYLARRHGRHGLLGYFYLNSFCAVRIAADALEIVNRNQPSNKPSIATTVVSSLGLSPLILGLAGFLHEAHYHLVATMVSQPAKVKQIKRWLYLAQIPIHGVAAVAMALVVIGSINIVEAKPTTNINQNEKLRIAGAMMMLFLWFGMAQHACWLLYKSRQVRVHIKRSLTQLIGWILIVVPLVGVKVGYAVAYTFDHQDSAINPVTGVFAVKLLLVVGVPMLAAWLMTWAGWRSVDIVGDSQRFEKLPLDIEPGMYDSGALMAQKDYPYASAEEVTRTPEGPKSFGSRS